jgi:hypothetical protein
MERGREGGKEGGKGGGKERRNKRKEGRREGGRRNNMRLGIVLHICNPSTGEAKTRSRAQGWPSLHGKTLSQNNI